MPASSCSPADACPTSSSISSSDPQAWRRAALTFAATALGLVALLYTFVIVIDPWDSLPFSPKLPRVPISSNARFSFPALARSPAFDSIILGTSTSRLLQPAQLDAAFGARFANLSMNSATAWEQTQLLAVFLRAHPAPRVVVIGLDAAWCSATNDRLTPRPFPEYLYAADRWPAYRHMLTPYAVQEAANQLMVLLHLKPRRYGLDGYTRFVPPDAAYDPARVDAAFARWSPIDLTPAAPATIALPALTLLGPALAAVPANTRTILYFPPIHASQQGAPGSATAARWSACKREAAVLAPHATIIDLMTPNPITLDRNNYWDPLHYREPIALWIATQLTVHPSAPSQGGSGALP